MLLRHLTIMKTNDANRLWLNVNCILGDLCGRLWWSKHAFFLKDFL